MNAAPLAEDKAAGGMALLLIDVIGTWTEPDTEPLLHATKTIAPCLADLKARCRRAGVPVIYVNDNRGRWRSDFKTLVQDAIAQGGEAAEIARLLEPAHDDYFVLKPKHSAFFSTPLDLLLEHLSVHRLILCGVSADQCVLATAADALMRDYDVDVVSDGIATPTPQRTQAALKHFEAVMKTSLRGSADIDLPTRP
jgi:nicotinamidase-related amidase